MPKPISAKPGVLSWWRATISPDEASGLIGSQLREEFQNQNGYQPHRNIQIYLRPEVAGGCSYIFSSQAYMNAQSLGKLKNMRFEKVAPPDIAQLAKEGHSRT
jgi:hypothetical protein